MEKILESQERWVKTRRKRSITAGKGIVDERSLREAEGDARGKRGEDLLGPLLAEFVVHEEP